MTNRLLSSLRKRLAPLGISAALLFAFAPQADAQCFSDDGYDASSCCSPAIPNLPLFPPSSLPGTGICWTDCTLSAQTCTVVALSPPTPSSTVCTQYTTGIDVLDCSGNQLMQGLVTLDYTRTWNEQTPTTSDPIQVWRFAAKVDMSSPLTGTPVCPVPSCAMTSASTAFYYGYVDYAFNCVLASWETAVVLYHGCDEFVHRPGFSAVPGVYHPPSTFAIVAPDTAANPFVVGVTLPPAGILVNEAMRRVTPDSSGTCFTEVQVQQGVFQPLVNGCLCPLSLTPPQQAGVLMNGSGVCGTAGFQTLNLFPVAPWYELITTSIGRWSNTSSYPGPESAGVAEGLLLYTDVCDPSGITTSSFDIFYGGLTTGGYTVLGGGGAPVPLTNRFVDLASNYSNLVGTPISFPLFGVVAPTDHLIYVNP
jgi:hypothetical protein